LFSFNRIRKKKFKMSERNFDTLDQEFNDDIFGTVEQYHTVDDDLLLSDPGLEQQFSQDNSNNNNAKEEEEQEEPQELEMRQLNKKKRKRRNNKKSHYESAVIGDSNLRGCDQYLDGVLFKLATKLKDGQHRLTHALNEVSQLKNIKTVVISALQNIINDEGIHRWSATVTKFVLRISTFATKRSDIQFIVIAPFLRIQHEDHGPLLTPITQQMRREFSAVRNVYVSDRFSASVEDLRPDGVHLNQASQERLFDILQQCFQMDWALPQNNSRQTESRRPVCSGAGSGFPDLRQFLSHRDASNQGHTPSRSRLPQVQSEDGNSTPLSRTQHRSRSPRHISRQSHSCVQRSEVERHHSSPVRRSRSRSPLINTIARYERAHLEMFGRYPNMESYFAHRQNNESTRMRSVSGPNRMQLSLTFLPPRQPSRPRERQLVLPDLRYRLYPRGDGSERD